MLQMATTTLSQALEPAIPGQKKILHVKIIEKRSFSEFIITDNTASKMLVVKDNKPSQAKYLETGKWLKIINPDIDDQSILVTLKTAIFMATPLQGPLFQQHEELPAVGGAMSDFLTLSATHELEPRTVSRIYI
jgi:hypothetical protein